MEVKMVQDWLTAVVGKAQILKVKFASDRFDFCFPLIIFNVICKKNLSDRVNWFKSFRYDRKEVDKAWNLIDYCWKICLIESYVTDCGLTVESKVACKSKAEDLKYLKYAPADSTKVSLDYIQTITALGNGA